MSLRESSKALKRLNILAAARKQFARLGFEGTTIRGIAAEAGVGVGTVLVYGESKQALLNEVWRQSTLPVVERALASAMGLPLLEGAMALFKPLLRAYAADLELARVVIKELPWLEGRAAQQHQPDLMRFVLALVTLVADEQSKRRLVSTLDPGVAANILFAIYYSACLELAVPSGAKNVEQVLGHLQERLQAVVGGWRVVQ